LLSFLLQCTYPQQFSEGAIAREILDEIVRQKQLQQKSSTVAMLFQAKDSTANMSTSMYSASQHVATPSGDLLDMQLLTDPVFRSPQHHRMIPAEARTQWKH